jgi:hypothetical protein
LLLYSITTHGEGLTLIGIHLNGIGVFQSGGNSYSLQASWTPRVGILESLSVRGDFGLTLLKNSFGNRFLAANYELLLCVPLYTNWSAEVGGGWATWFANGGTRPILSANGVLGLNEEGKEANILDRIFVGYSHFFLTGNGAHELKAGVGLSL